MLGETEKSSDGCRTASLSEMDHEQRAATSSTVTDQRRKNFFVRKLSFVTEVLPYRRVLLIGDDFGMWRDFKIAAVCHFWFSKFTVYVNGFFRHAILLHIAKICWIRTMLCWVMSKNNFENGNHPPSWILKVLIFGHQWYLVIDDICFTTADIDLL